ncbi:DNA-binding protein [Ectothiorhodospiraceae bacterium BW-2]|nr:DNA-binding protein [Ectothiorhodospiraceae bacterium BW-2]
MSYTDAGRRLLTEIEAADRLNLHRNTLTRWRMDGRNLAYIKIGKAVRYDPAEIERFMQANRVETA